MHKYYFLRPEEVQIVGKEISKPKLIVIVSQVHPTSKKLTAAEFGILWIGKEVW
jgi:hypothetical protein